MTSPKTIEKTEILKLWVSGEPKTKGSWRAIQSKTTGRIIQIPAGTKKSAKARKDWEKAVGTAAWTVWGETRGDPELFEEPLSVEVYFHLPRGKTVKRDFPISIQDGDLDKLLRSILDSLTGTVYHDDSQVVDVTMRKRYADGGQPPGVDIQLFSLEMSKADPASLPIEKAKEDI